MSIYFVGDPHGRWDLILPSVIDYRPEAVVLLGDMGLHRPLHLELEPVLKLGIKIFWIPGNHDCDTEADYRYLFESELGSGTLHGEVRTIGGLRVAGLGGVFRERIWRPGADRGIVHPNPESLRRASRGPGRGRADAGSFRNGLPIRHCATIWRDDLAKLGQLTADILVLHEAPETHENGFRELGVLAETMGVARVIHGHHHRSYRGRTLGQVPVIGLSVAEIVDENGNVISAGER